VLQVRSWSGKGVKQLLMVPGVDVNMPNSNTGRTPLMVAVEKKQVSDRKHVWTGTMQFGMSAV
jgi:hypothetical protein